MDDSMLSFLKKHFARATTGGVSIGLVAGLFTAAKGEPYAPLIGVGLGIGGAIGIYINEAVHAVIDSHREP